MNGPAIQELNERSRDIFRQVVETYVETGAPVGSRLISKRLEARLSPASVRNVMSDLEDLGLLYAPHTSAGRLPTPAGLRLFVEGLLEVGALTEQERNAIEGKCAARGRSVPEVLNEAIGTLSGLSGCAGLVFAPKRDTVLQHVELVSLPGNRALVVIVDSSGMVENRIFDLPPGLTPAQLAEAANYLVGRVRGHSLPEARFMIKEELESKRSELDDVAARVVSAGLAVWAGSGDQATLIVKGQAHLLEDVSAMADLERIRRLFDELEEKENLLRLISLTEGADGVRIFIGAESNLFSLAGCSMIVAPFQDRNQQIVGALGVIGPQRMNYARVIPMVDFTAQVVGRLIG